MQKMIIKSTCQTGAYQYKRTRKLTRMKSYLPSNKGWMTFLTKRTYMWWASRTPVIHSDRRQLAWFYRDALPTLLQIFFHLRTELPMVLAYYRCRPRRSRTRPLKLCHLAVLVWISKTHGFFRRGVILNARSL